VVGRGQSVGDHEVAARWAQLRSCALTRRNRLDVVYPVRFYGSVEAVERGDGTSSFTWVGGDIVEALAHDIPIPGCNTRNCNNIRLWQVRSDLSSLFFCNNLQSRPGNDFDLDSFNKGDYVGAVRASTPFRCNCFFVSICQRCFCRCKNATTARTSPPCCKCLLAPFPRSLYLLTFLSQVPQR
jgi:hypothetical protein